MRKRAKGPAPQGPGTLQAGQKLYVVQRRSWRASWRGFFHGDDDSGQPVQAFADRAQAEAACEALERQARREFSPFRFLQGDLELAANGGEEAFLKALKRLGVKAPPKKALREELSEDSWRLWWDAMAADLSDEQRESTWALFPEDRFYDVVETELDTEG